jgi:hypothetical protein
MHFLFSLLKIINWIKSASRWFHYTNISIVVYVAPPEDEQVVHAEAVNS